MSRYTDLVAFVRGLEMISKAVVEHQGRNLNRVYNNSSIKEAVQKCSSTVEKSQSNLDTSFPNLTKQASNIVESVQQQDFTELKNQASRVIEKVQQKDFTGLSHQASKVIESVQKQDFTELTKEASKAIENLQKQNFSELSKQASRVVDSMQDNMMASSQSVKDDVKPDLAENESTLRYETTTKDDSNHIREEMSTDDEQLHTKNDTSMKGSINDQANDPLQGVNTTPREPPIILAQETSGRDDAKPIPTPIKPNRNKPIGAKLSQSLSDRARERRVPSSRLGRLMSYGSLAAGLGVGAMAEVARRGMGLSDSSDKIGVLDKNPLLSDANAERIVNTLCRVRGAALKLGQMLSIQDSSMINPDVQRIFERVRQSADFMPKAQLDKAMRTELGNDWRNKFESFDDKPFAAASIGQVHRGTTLDGREVAVKIQYPGVADSINSDINNLMAVLNIWQILPKGLYVEEFIETAKEELSWECDYEERLLAHRNLGKALVKDDPVFYVPEVISELSSKRVMTSELVSGAPLDSAMSLDQDTKNFIAENLLRLCLQELFVFNYMQTDPNWSNFLYDKATKRICLLDFGSAREYSKENFVDGYLRIIKGAADGKKDEVLEWSKKLGFLTGYESKAMQNAHVDAVMILGEAFSEDIFDFSTQTTTQRIQTIIPVMLKHRLTPPPEETYSLHRKLSGSYLLCTKFSAKIQCKKSLDEIWKNYHFLNLEAAPTSS